MALIEKAKNWIVRHSLNRCHCRDLLLLVIICSLGAVCLATLQDAKAAKDKRGQMEAVIFECSGCIFWRTKRTTRT